MFWNLLVSIGAWVVSCIVWAAIVMVGMTTISPGVSLKAHLIIEGVLLAYWLILPYSVPSEGEKQTKLQSRIFSGHFVAFRCVTLSVYLIAYSVEAVHMLESGISNTAAVAMFAVYLITTAVIWRQKWAGSVKCVLLGLAGPVSLISFAGVLKMAVTLTTTGSLAFVVIALLFYLLGFITDLSGKYDKQSIDLS